MKTKKELKNFYSFKNYKPNKNAVAIDYKGTHYLSKAQCMALEGITRKELDAYLKNLNEGLKSFDKATNEEPVDDVITDAVEEPTDTEIDEEN